MEPLSGTYLSPSSHLQIFKSIEKFVVRMEKDHPNWNGPWQALLFEIYDSLLGASRASGISGGGGGTSPSSGAFSASTLGSSF